MPIPFWNEIRKEDLPGDLREIADGLGMEAVHYLVETWGGMQIYVPSRQRFERLWRDRRIAAEFDGRNAGELAAKYDVSRNYVMAVVRDSVAPADQGDLFAAGGSR